MSKKRAFLISFEGVEGSGKSTQCKLLCSFFKKQGIKYAIFREPGSSAFGEQIRSILLHTKGKLTGFSETLLFVSARNQLRQEKIEPALKTKDVVILDRYTDATVAYQGYGSGVDLGLIRQLNKIAIGDVIPDLTILLDLKPEIGIMRSGRNDRFEKRKLGFHKKVRHGYLKLAEKYPRRIKLIKADKQILLIQDKIRDIVTHELKRRKSR